MTDFDTLGNSFMSSTGFGATNNKPPAPTTPLTPVKTSSSATAFQKSHEPTMKAAGFVPGTISGGGDDNPGFVPGRLEDQHVPLDQKRKTDYFAAPNKIEKPSFVQPRPTRQGGWQAVGVGKKTNNPKPGHLATSPVKSVAVAAEKLAGMENPLPASWCMPVALGLVAMSGWIVMTNRQYGKYSGSNLHTGMIIALWGLAAYVMITCPKEAQHGVAAAATADCTGSGSRDSRVPWGGQDTSRRQYFAPKSTGVPDPSPYPKDLDQQNTTLQRMQAQGVDMNNIEGPRGDYDYKHGPTPANRQRLQQGDLMRTAAMYNMDEREFAEYMRRLEGGAPDQFHQAHPYHPLSAHEDHRPQLNDMDTMYGVSTQPGQMNRKNKYRDPRMAQAGAKTSHLKNPPPAGYDTMDKTHPWMESTTENEVAFGTDQYVENMMPQVATNSDNHITNNDVGRIASNRNQEDSFYANMYGQDNRNEESPEKPLPPELQPVQTSRKGIEKEKMDREREIHAQSGQGVAPHPQNRPIQQPQTLVTPDHIEQTQGKPTRNTGMGAPPSTELLTGKDDTEKAEAEFGASFSLKPQPSDKTIHAAQQDVRRG